MQRDRWEVNWDVKAACPYARRRSGILTTVVARPTAKRLGSNRQFSAWAGDAVAQMQTLVSQHRCCRSDSECKDGDELALTEHFEAVATQRAQCIHHDSHPITDNCSEKPANDTSAAGTCGIASPLVRSGVGSMTRVGACPGRTGRTWSRSDLVQYCAELWTASCARLAAPANSRVTRSQRSYGQIARPRTHNLPVTVGERGG